MAGFNGGGMATVFKIAKEMARLVQGGQKLEDTGIPKISMANQESLECGFSSQP
ncbi:hypothetical protein BT63DRAFT_423848 [Microthyrium microscopicum]|uniref:Uncharacterized protein n=1 Tax=Microthyrium microscopicum TaxID=703497 RepID=A0A6A6UC63_9PEZI|nr:hypothetical protein BT63DRAFT_423848 [Microthyrium microscopicum]